MKFFLACHRLSGTPPHGGGKLVFVLWNIAVRFTAWVESLLNPPVILAKRLTPDGDILLPKLEGDVGYDLVVSEDTVIPPWPARPTRVPTGVAIKIPKGYYVHLFGRSSTATKLNGLMAIATIDNGYTGEMSTQVWNMNAEPVTIPKGSRLGQLVIFRLNILPIRWVEELPTTARGDKGFGSTGK